ncbi:MAG: hypothetical protein HY084_08345 [Gemmatimonadetes bacterium]|nr:hypothetical protein [Gemmatimonadota bacterium]
MILRQFNADGLEQCRSVLASIRHGEIARVPRAFTEDDRLSHPVSSKALAAPPTIANRWELAIWLWRSLDDNIPEGVLLSSDGFWTWMAFWLFDVIAPAREGVRKIGEDARVILDRSNRRRWYRHLLAGPYLLMRAHHDNPARLRAMLAGTPDTPGELYEQLAGRKEIVTSPAVVDVFSRLYWNPTRNSIKRGAAGRGPGSANRFGKLLEQLDVTYDLGTTPTDRLFMMMPEEFTRFKT